MTEERDTSTDRRAAAAAVLGMFADLGKQVVAPVGDLLSRAFEVDIDKVDAAGKSSSKVSDRLRNLKREHQAALQGAADAHPGWLFSTGLAQAAEAGSAHLAKVGGEFDDLGTGLSASADKYRAMEEFGTNLLTTVRDQLQGTR